MSSGKYDRLLKFEDISKELIIASYDDDCDISVDESQEFAAKAEQYMKTLSEVNVITKRLKTH